jgi:hypothetical protein
MSQFKGDSYMRTSYSSLFMVIIVLLFTIDQSIFSQTSSFDYKRYLFGSPSTLSLSVQSLDKSTGKVTVNGGDSQGPTTPFMWNWGDGSVTSGFFPQSHTYTTTTKNYILNVTAYYSGGAIDSTGILLRFVPPSVNPITLSPDIAVTIPNKNVTLVSRQQEYGFSSTLSYFGDSFFITLSRAVLEYVASVAAGIENDFVNNNVFVLHGQFQQVMLRDSAAGGAYSIWYSNPVAFGVGDAFLIGSIGYSSLFHEMGHNLTLNSPANYYYGGKIDGNANAIFSETMAQIFQHAAGYEIINTYKTYGLSDDVMYDIKNSLISSAGLVRTSYNHYLSSGKRFSSWNDPNTTVDETFDTFMTIAYKFMEQAENTGQGYKNPLKRMLRLLQGFNANWLQRYDPLRNTAAADTFRATLMTAAVSFGFAKDLRSDFRNLNFPLSDQLYNELYHSVTSVEDIRPHLPPHFELSNNFPNPFNPSTTLSFNLPTKSFVVLKIFDALGKEVYTVLNEELSAGTHSRQWNAATMPSGMYLYRLSAVPSAQRDLVPANGRTGQAGAFTETKKLILLR